jgi:fibronectin type 3 domain-containing protein
MKSKSILTGSITSHLWFLAIVTIAAANPDQGIAQTVPAEFQDLYNTLSTDLNHFNANLNSIWNGSKFPTVFAGNLAVANGNSGPGMLSNYNPGAQFQLQAIKASGAKAVLVQAGFPILYAPFYDFLATQPGYTGVTYEAFVSYYQQMARDVRAAGLKLIVENTILLSDDVQAGWGPGLSAYYATLNWDQYEAARAQCALNIAQIIQPDNLVVLQEPSNEASQTGQSDVNTASGATSMLNQILVSLAPVRASMKVGAGVANWQPQIQDFIQSFVTLPLDTIDLHIYPVNSLGPPNNLDFMANALTVASMAAAAGKQLSVTEAWLWKMRDSEWNVLTADQIRARNPFDFWAPLDAYFLQLLVNFGYYTNAAFVAPCGPYYFAAYLPYDSTTQNLSPGDILNQETAAAAQANANANYTSTATSYHDSLVSPPDTIPPSTPAIVSSSAGTNTASVSWTASTDNVGVAGYYVQRNGASIASTAQTQFNDTGLGDNTTYTYQIQAFDLGGNVSAPATATITTRNGTTPNPPVNVAGTAVSCTQITISWSPPGGNVPITSYLVFQGSSPANVVQTGQTYGTTTSFNAAKLTPGTTYYFGVQAASSGLISPMSAIIAVTTLAAPTAPANVAASPASCVRVTMTWSASTGGMPIAAYHIFRGSTPSSLSQLDARTTTSYNDISVSAATTYYYAVQAVDTGGDLSPMSLTVRVTTPALPSAPSGVTATANSASKVTLTWLASTGGMPISKYQVFRGSSPGNLGSMGYRTTTSFIDTAVSPSTTYCYAVQAVDTGGDISALSTVVCVTTPALPSAPANLAITPVSAYKLTLTWTASTGGLAIASYRIYRGSTPLNLVQVATRSTTSYTDTSLAPATTYYYAVQAVDTGGCVSAMSATVRGATPALPSSPGSLSATAISKKQINVTWSASTGGLPIGSYRIYRGGSPANLAQMAIRTGTSYTDTAVSPGTTYYYAVQAVDTGGDISPMSATVPATTPN